MFQILVLKNLEMKNIGFFGKYFNFIFLEN